MQRAGLFLAAAALLAFAAPAAAHCNYIIEEGETLSQPQIAENYDIELVNVTALNPQIEDPNEIFEGDVIRLPCENQDKEKNIAELLAHRDDTFYVFTAAVKAGLAEALSDNSEKLTLFAPTDDAFAAFLKEKNLNLTAVLADTELLADILKYHVSPDGAVKSEDLSDGQEISTLLDDQSLMVSIDNGTVTIKTSSGQEARVTTADLKGGRSVVHLIDTVMLPGEAAKPAPTPKPAPKPTPKPTTPEDKPTTTDIKPVPEKDIPCTHVVKENDTLFDLSKKYSTTVEDLVKLNPTVKEDPDLIAVGITLKIKAKC